MNEPKPLGELQQLLLLALLRLGDEAYGAAIRRELRAVAGRKLSISAIYVTLVRMEEQGLVASQDGTVPATGGRPRRCFEITRSGRAALKATRAAADKMWSGVEI
ncbi:MAG: helix-turn-helix transcriptional regulator [Acidobacteriota bacterium]|jgi:DNA-binding PadR family transcriptional regulator